MHHSTNSRPVFSGTPLLQAVTYFFPVAQVTSFSTLRLRALKLRACYQPKYTKALFIPEHSRLCSDQVCYHGVFYAEDHVLKVTDHEIYAKSGSLSNDRFLALDSWRR